MNQAAIAVKGLSKRFGQKSALQDFSLNLAYGEIFAAVGGNGGGKTTALRLLSGLLKPDSGQGQVMGCDLIREASRIRRQIGYMSQQYALYATLTVWENLYCKALIYTLPAPVQVASRLLDQFDLTAFRNIRVGQLSGGWMRRAQLACALIASPKLLVLDEPTAGLDVQARREIWEMIRSQRERGGCVVISTHDLDEVPGCDQVALFEEGRVMAQDSPQQLLKLSGQTNFTEAIVALSAARPC